MKRICVAIIALLQSAAFVAVGHAQTGIISTYAGPSLPVNGTLAIASGIDDPRSVITDGAGGFYFSSWLHSNVYHVTSEGLISTIAGTGVTGFGGDGGPATSARLRGPIGLAIDGFGNLFIADTDNNRIRKVSPGGVISTVAGTGVLGFSGDGGPATDAMLALPHGVALDGSGNLYIADYFNNRIRKISDNGVISTVAGAGISGFSGDGSPATSAWIAQPSGVAVDGSGNIFIADTFNFRIRKVSTGGLISTVAGNGFIGFSGDGGPATSAHISSTSGLAVDGSGNLYIADDGNSRIRKVSAGGVISTLAGSGADAYSGDGGPATVAALGRPTGVAVDGGGNVYIADRENHRIRKVSNAGVISTAAGSGTGGFSGDGGPATAGKLRSPSAVALDGSGNLYIADNANNRIRKVSVAGVITTVAGSGAFVGPIGDGGPATAARLNSPSDVAVDSSGNLYIAEDLGLRIRKVSPDGIISTVAGTGSFGFTGDGGPAVSAQLNAPSGVAVDGAGNLYIADSANNRIRKVSTDGVINTVAGSAVGSFGGDGGPATSAKLLQPRSVGADGVGNLYIADTTNQRIRKVSVDGLISTVAGTGSPGSSGDGGPATAAQISAPWGIDVDTYGNLYISEALSRRIRKISTTGVITTVAGSGSGFGGDGGPATSATMMSARDVAVDASQNLYIADQNNHRIRKVTMGRNSAFGRTPLLRGDFNGDGNSDILWQYTDGSVSSWLMNGSTPVSAGGLIGALTGWNARKVGDFNGDGNSDILWQHTDGRIVMWLMSGLNVIGSTGSLVDPSGGWAVNDVGDFNGDGKSDILWQHLDGGAALWLMDGTNVIGATGLIGAGTGWTAKWLADFNGDGNTDILWQHADTSSVIWLLNGTNVIGASGSLVASGSGWTVWDQGDFNGDGKSDLVWRHTDGSAGIWLMNGLTATGGGGLVGPGTGWSVKHVGDFNSDGKSDLVWQHTDGAAGIWLMNGSSVDSGNGLVGPGSGWTVNRIGDFNNDGKIDLLWQHSNGSAGIWLMNGLNVTSATGLLGSGTGWSPAP